jgi:hypothetical protein
VVPRRRHLNQRQRHLLWQPLGVLIEALTNPPRALATDRNDAQFHRDIAAAVLLLDFMTGTVYGLGIARYLFRLV